MKASIKKDIQLHIIAFVFLLIMSIVAVYILLTSEKPEESRIMKVVPAIAVLEEGKPLPLGDKSGTLRLVNSTKSFPNCADCMETAHVEVVKGNESRTLDFRFGGIAGFYEDTAKAFDYTFILRELLDNSVIVEYEKVVNTAVN